MTLKLYGSPISPYARAVRMTFVEKNLSYEFESIGPADLKAPDYAQRHPYRKLPALDIDGQPLFETTAIMRYLDEAHASGRSLSPVAALPRAYSDQWLSVACSYLYSDIFNGLIFQRMFAPQFGMPVSEDLISESVEKTRHHLRVITDALSTGALGKDLTLGDILVGAILLPLPDFDEGRTLLDEHAAIRAYVHALGKRQSAISTAP